MHKVLLLGAGKIGRMIARFLVDTGDYELLVGDFDESSLRHMADATGADTVQLDATDSKQLSAAMQDRDSVVSALSYYFNPTVAAIACEVGASYFDLTEDVETTKRVSAIAEKSRDGQIFMPQCGLAPGFISIVANDLASRFDK